MANLQWVNLFVHSTFRSTLLPNQHVIKQIKTGIILNVQSESLMPLSYGSGILKGDFG
jgi:hypothetical protein